MSAELVAYAEVGPGLRDEAMSMTVQGELVCGHVACGSRSGRTGVVLVHGWSGYRNGPHGLLTALARTLAAAGYPSLRFDFRGRGESGGQGLESSLLTMADDLVAASEWFARAHGLQRLVYVGLCSGGNVTVGTLARLPLAAGLVLLSVYPFSDGDAFGRDVHRTWHYAGVYLRKALRAETWSRLFQGDVRVGQVLQVLFGHFLKRGRNRRKEGAETAAATSTAAAAGNSGAGLGRTAKAVAHESRKAGQEAPKKHLANLRKDLPVLMVYGTADPDAAAAQPYFGDYARDHGLPMEFVEIPGASHNFTSIAWKEELGRLTVAFLQRQGF